MTPSSRAPLVVDASAALEPLLRSQADTRVANLMRVTDPVAPAHLDPQVLSAFSRLARREKIHRDLVAPRCADSPARPSGDIHSSPRLVALVTL